MIRGKSKPKKKQVWSIWDGDDLGIDLMFRGEKIDNPPRILEPLPIEVARQIASHLLNVSTILYSLPPPFVTNLLTTCKALRDVGEICRWRRVSFRIAAGYCDHPSDFLESNTNPSKSLQKDLQWLWNLVLALERYPIRQLELQHLQIGIYDGPSGEIASGLLQLLEVCAPTIQTLTLAFRFPGCCLVHLGRPWYRAQTFIDRLLRSAFPLPRLRTLILDLNVGDDIFSQLDSIIHRFGGVTRLFLRTKTRSCDLSTVSVISPLSTTLPMIKTIHFSRLSSAPHVTRAISKLQAFLAACPNVEYLSLQGNWPSIDAPFDDLQATILGLDLNVFWANLGLSERLLRPPAPERKLAAFIQPSRHTKTIHQITEKEINTILKQIPQSAERIIVATTSGQSKRQSPIFTDKAVGVLNGWQTDAFISARDLVYVTVAPLWTITMSAGIEEILHRFEPRFWPTNNFAGCVIRSYAHPRLGEVFWDVRVLSYVTNANKCIKGDTGCRCWAKKSRFIDRKLESAVLNEVYKAAKMSPNWLKGGRRMKLPDEAWKILETWASRSR